MLACKGIFARPSMPQPREARGGDSWRGAKHTFLWLLYHDVKTIVNITDCEI